MTSSQSTQYQIVRKVTLIGSVIDAVLSVLKISVGLIGQSQALIADGVHSLSDLVTDVMVIWAAKHAHAEPDDEHPYGHERIETIATIALSLALLAVAIGFCYDAVTRLLGSATLHQPGWLALSAAVISMGAKEWIYHYTKKAADSINSDLLRANAWHSRSDAASSFIVLLGVIGVMLGFVYADLVASIGVSLMIGWIGWTLGRKGIEELIDTSVEPDLLLRIRNTIENVQGVVDAHQVRTRKMAGKIVMDTHIRVNPTISVSEGHRIGDAVELRLHKTFEELSDITVHIDYEDDASERPGYHLPLRNEVIEALQTVLQSNKNVLNNIQVSDFSDIKIHYLKGKVQLELWLDSTSTFQAKHPEMFESTLIDSIIEIEYVSEVKLVYEFVSI